MIRHRVRDQADWLWMPYTASQVAALRGIVSCWMDIAILETLSGHRIRMVSPPFDPV